MNTSDRALCALFDHWAKSGSLADRATITRIHMALEDRRAAGGGSEDWRALLEGALRDLGFTIDWQGDAVSRITAPGGFGGEARGPCGSGPGMTLA
ncbi:hypothetical protein [Methylobacterium planeticum]|uniref:Uncharacterized protein n=1 Tax=Methylobacterium planeticum TaxID=2615211 RepID=A0A6N6MWU0_9HYPH|nr:hypothetical protein [Methylobacterium planeticum]KAB1074414.1 hypothetical protein F6X51_08615 [Methylobacterium planeticum]